MRDNAPTLISRQKCFHGWQERYRHRAATLACDMVFGLYLPPQAVAGARVPVLYWLSGLTCTDENFEQKAGAQRMAAECGVALVTPDTSPRGPGVPGAPDGSWDLGLGAGFYLNASEAPWARHYRMYDYVVQELPGLVEAHFPVTAARSIAGHSMGGHGALVCALKNPGRYCSVSAFAPIANPMNCPWGEKAFRHYLGPDRQRWQEWDASMLLAHSKERLPLLVDQGEADAYLEEQLKPQALAAAARACQYPLTLRLQPGYDHSYFFIASFIGEHVHYHAKALRLASGDAG